MHFDFSVISKKNKSKSNRIKTSIYTTIKKNIYCVAGINLDGTYYAIDIETNEKYIISSRSYSIKTNVYYSQELINGKRLHITELRKRSVNNQPTIYLPFAPGVGLIGNLVKNTVIGNNIMFDLIKTFDMPRNNEIACNEFINFKNNYEEIRKNIINKYAESNI